MMSRICRLAAVDATHRDPPMRLHKKCTTAFLLTTLSLSGCGQQKSPEEILVAFKDAGARIERNSHGQVNSIGCDVNSQVDDELLKDLRGLTNLEKLNLNFSTKITDAGLRHVSRLTNLRELYLSRVQGISDSGLKHLRRLGNLEKLVLSGTKTSDEGVAHLKELSRLRTLVLSDTEVTDSGVRNLQQALPNCAIQK